MTISLSNAGKRFNREWIFRYCTYDFEAGQSYAIIGPNGSGKSTLLQVLSGSMMINEGSIRFFDSNWSRKAAGTPDDRPPAAVRQPMTVTYQPSLIPAEAAYKHISFCAPYLEVVEEMTLAEFLDFHRSFKPFLPGLTTDFISTEVGLEKALHKQIRYYSSGMKQRVKLAQCIFSDTPVVLLDEPCTNLDAAGIELYHRLIQEYCSNRLIIVSSNDEVEYRFCKEKIDLLGWKEG